MLLSERIPIRWASHIVYICPYLWFCSCLYLCKKRKKLIPVRWASHSVYICPYLWFCSCLDLCKKRKTIIPVRWASHWSFDEKGRWLTVLEHPVLHTHSKVPSREKWKSADLRWAIPIDYCPPQNTPGGAISRQKIFLLVFCFTWYERHHLATFCKATLATPLAVVSFDVIMKKKFTPANSEYSLILSKRQSRPRRKWDGLEPIFN